MPKDSGLITQSAFIRSDYSRGLERSFYTLSFPKSWCEIILDLNRHGKPNPNRIKQVPIRRLNNALAALAPDLISVATFASSDDNSPWLYATSPYPLRVIAAFVFAWLRDLRPEPEAFRRITEAAKVMQPESLKWDEISVDLAGMSLSAGGTAVPEGRLYRLLPDVLADRVVRQAPFEFNRERLQFVRVASLYENGSELMSWPPLQHRQWRFSGTINITMQTIPFSSQPRLYVRTGIRRWVQGSTWFTGSSATVYLHANSPWVEGAPEANRFACARLARKGKCVEWKDPQPGLLRQLSIRTASFPEAEDLARNPDKWIQSGTGVQAAVVHHTRMGGHGINPGLLPVERRRITEWVAQALAPEFRFADDLIRVDGKAIPYTVLKRRASMPKDGNPVETAAAVAKNAGITVENSRLQRQLLADACAGELNCYIFGQTDLCRVALVSAIGDHLGVCGVENPRGTWEWKTPELVVRAHSVHFSLGGQLGESHNVNLAVAERRKAVSDLCRSLPYGPSARLVLVELDGKDAFQKTTTDPKSAIRLGCVDGGLVSQFIRTFRPEDVESSESDDGAHRARAAWMDGLRQLGARFIPESTLEVPESLNQVAFWIVRRNFDSSRLGTQYTPIAVMIRPREKTILGQLYDSESWVPYPVLLRDLAGRPRPPQLQTREQQQYETAAFIRRILYKLRNEQSLVFFHAQNIRASAPGLTNYEMEVDKIRLGNGSARAHTMLGKNLRIVRVRTSERGETPQSWSPKADGLAGFAKGLWRSPLDAARNRVFFSVVERSSKIQTVLDAAKLTARNKKRSVVDKTTGIEEITNRPVTDPKAVAWNPSLLEVAVLGVPPGESPETWAMYVHQQRQPPEHREGLRLPLVLHLADRAGEYALPHVLEIPGVARRGSKPSVQGEGDADDS